MKHTAFEKSIYWLINTFGYDNVIRFKDVLLLVAGVSIGALIMAILISRFLYRVEKVEQMGKVVSVAFKHAGKAHYFTRANNFYINSDWHITGS